MGVESVLRMDVSHLLLIIGVFLGGAPASAAPALLDTMPIGHRLYTYSNNYTKVDDVRCVASLNVLKIVMTGSRELQHQPGDEAESVPGTI